MAEAESNTRNLEKKSFLATLGPGLITGASDDDPSGIATYSQTGAQFGYGMLWSLTLSYPLMCAIQMVAGKIGRVTGRGLAGNIRRNYSAWVLYPIVFLVVVANTINLGADIGAMGDSVAMVAGGPSLLYCALLAIVSAVLQVFVPYRKYVSVLKWLTLALFAYVATIFAIKVDWGEALRGTFLPSMKFDAKTITTIVAVLGTTISPYLFFWQASQETEEIEIVEEDQPLAKAPEQAPYHLGRIKVDTYVGMGFSNLVAWFIMLTVAATLHAKGVTTIESSTKAAEALRPVAGPLAFALFAAGIVGTGLLAIPVLAGSAAYAVGEALKWPVGLERAPLQAKGFYIVMSAAILIGLGLNFFHINPITALFWSAVINGVAAGPIMVLMMLLASRSDVMQDFAISKKLRFWGWLSTAVMIASAISLFAFWGK